MPLVLHAVLELLLALGVPAAVPPAPVVHVAPVALTPTGTGWAELDAAVQRIPGYAAAAPTSWRVDGRAGHWGSTLLPAEQVSISRAVPARLLDAVVRHEWSHVLQSRVYGGDTRAMVTALDATFGGPGGADRAADCMARQLGATWTHYTTCADPRWRAAAAVLLSARRV